MEAQVGNTDPNTLVAYAEAIDSPYHRQWMLSMDDEIKELDRNTWLQRFATGTKAIKSKGVYLTRTKDEGNTKTRRAGLVGKGYSRKHGID